MKKYDYDPVMALNAANAFFSMAGDFLMKIPDEKEAAARFTIDKKGKLVAAASNLVFSIELYLKSLALSTGRCNLATHNLPKLFGNLPQVFQDSLRKAYQERLSKVRAEESAALEIVMTRNEEPPKESEVKKQITEVGNSLEKLLEKEQDGFRSWRYFYEFPSDQNILVYSFEYKRLGILVNSIQEHIRGVN